MQGRTDGSSASAKKSKWSAAAVSVVDPAEITPDRMANAVTVPIENYSSAKADKRVLSEKQQGGYLYFAVELRLDERTIVVVRRYLLPMANGGPGSPASATLPAPLVEGQ